MKPFLLFAFLSMTCFGADEFKVPAKSSKKTLLAASLIKTKKFRPKRKRRNYFIGVQPEPIYNLYFGNVSYETYLGKIQGRETYLALRALIEGRFFCDIDFVEMIKHQGPYKSFDELLLVLTDCKQMTKDEAKLCVICQDKETEYAPTACGHLCMCKGCLEQMNPRKCPLCRAPANSCIKIYK